MTSTKPRTWAIPDEPGPEVTALRDRHGNLWPRTQDGWECPRPETDEPGKAVHFYAQFPKLLLHYGPLTDASAEQDLPRRDPGSTLPGGGRDFDWLSGSGRHHKVDAP